MRDVYTPKRSTCRIHGKVVAIGPLEKVFFDVIGPVPTTGKGGYKYVLTLVDEFTGMYFVRLIRRKSEV